MASKKNKKIGGMLCCCDTDIEMSKLRQENTDLRKSLDESTMKPSDYEDNHLLERILSLETLREKSSQQLMAKDQDIASLTQKLLTGRETVVGLQAQIDHYLRGAEQRERFYQSLQAETEDVKNTLVAVSAKCQEVEGRNNAGQQSRPSDGQTASSTAAVMQEKLRDALEKNQQWLAYDQQREDYTKSVLAWAFGLEQQLNQTKEALTQQHNEAHSDERRAAEMQEHYDQLLRTAKMELEGQREQVHTAQTELEGQREQVHTAQRQLTEMQRRYQEKSEMKQQLQVEKELVWKSAQEERRRSGDREGRLRAETEDLQGRLEEERQMSTELQLQIQVSGRDLEDERRDCQHLQKQLHKVLRELRKAKDDMDKLESEKELKRTSLSPHLPNLLDESFLVCPSCQAQYPASQHRELLNHLDHCLG